MGRKRPRPSVGTYNVQLSFNNNGDVKSQNLSNRYKWISDNTISDTSRAFPSSLKNAYNSHERPTNLARLLPFSSNSMHQPSKNNNQYSQYYNNNDNGRFKPSTDSFRERSTTINATQTHTSSPFISPFQENFDMQKNYCNNGSSYDEHTRKKNFNYSSKKETINNERFLHDPIIKHSNISSSSYSGQSDFERNKRPLLKTPKQFNEYPVTNFTSMNSKSQINDVLTVESMRMVDTYAKSNSFKRSHSPDNENFSLNPNSNREYKNIERENNFSNKYTLGNERNDSEIFKREKFDLSDHSCKEDFFHENQSKSYNFHPSQSTFNQHQNNDQTMLNRESNFSFPFKYPSNASGITSSLEHNKFSSLQRRAEGECLAWRDSSSEYLSHGRNEGLKTFETEKKVWDRKCWNNSESSNTEDDEDLRIHLLRVKQQKIDEQLKELERKSKETDRKLSLLQKKGHYF